MRTIKINTYDYETTNNNDGRSIFMGIGEKNFLHQMIADENRNVRNCSLEDAISEANDEAKDYASSNKITVEFTSPEYISISGTRIGICDQKMTMSNGMKGTQENAYFFDPDNGVFKMMQFGMIPVNESFDDEQYDLMATYSKMMTKRLLARMFIENSISVPNFESFSSFSQH